MEFCQAIIIGGGFSGIGAAIKLDEAGFGDFCILEQNDGIGGHGIRTHIPVSRSIYRRSATLSPSSKIPLGRMFSLRAPNSRLTPSIVSINTICAAVFA